MRPEQKREEMALADLVLAPGSFVERTIREFHPDKKIARAPYGVDCEFWHPAARRRNDGPLRFIYAGQLSLRKGIPVLLQAWQKAALRDAELELVGSWHLGGEQAGIAAARDLATVAVAGRSSRAVSARQMCSCFHRTSRGSVSSCWRRWPAVCRQSPPKPPPART